MKKCNRFFDAIESGSFNENSAEWQDLIFHAGRCPDCATAMHGRRQLLENLSLLPEPDYPAGLHQLIMEQVEQAGSKRSDSENSGAGIIAKFLDFSLRPLEFAIPLACLLMFVFLMEINETADEDISLQHAVVARQNVSEKINAVNPVVNKLEKVEVAEVNEFLRQLEEFRRLHPESIESEKTYAPSVELVNDVRYWRNR